jgi:ABC-2 type transport system permease protein
MSVKGTLRFLGALTATNLKASMALRGAFWAQVIFMALNNLIFFVMWWIFFDRFKEVNGWRIEDMAALYGMVAGAFGLAMIFVAGARELARYIAEGDLDSFLTQPKSALLQSVASRSNASGWGDVASGFFLLYLSGYFGVAEVFWGLVGMICGAAVFLATMVIVHSMAFWLGHVGALARQVSEFLIIFSVYPKTIFSGALKFLLFTVLPAGFVSYLPVELVRGFNLPTLAAVVGGALLYSALAFAVFSAGLRRYESGSRFGVRA